MSSKPSPAVTTAKYIQDRDREDAIITLENGVRIRILPVSATLIDEVTSRIEDPEVPMWKNPDKDRDEPNPNDPKYIKALRDADRRRGVASMDAMVMFGVELVDGVPEVDGWLKKLQALEHLGRLDLSAYDLNDPIDIEFLYKRFVIADARLLEKIGKKSGLGAEDLERAERSFPSD